jgi:hypothetical protein
MDDRENELAREIANQVLKAIEPRLQIHFEGVQGLIKVAAEGYGGTLESIGRRLDRIEKDWRGNLGIHLDALPYFIAE